MLIMRDQIIAQRGPKGEKHGKSQQRHEMAADFDTVDPEIIDHQPRNKWQAERDHRGKDKRESRPDQVPFIRFDERPQRPQRADLFAGWPVFCFGLHGFGHRASFVSQGLM
jgi:hypothetical protein